ncbi:Uncharacterised protein [Klebsiella pneumoniae]|nr:Uncharacterised protein [Klebsiella pneumoniae]
MNKLTALRVLHKCNSGGQLRQQVQILSIARRFGVFHQRQNTDGITAKFNFIFDITKKRSLSSISKRPNRNKVIGQVSNRPIDRLTKVRLLSRLPPLNQRIG